MKNLCLLLLVAGVAVGCAPTTPPSEGVSEKNESGSSVAANNEPAPTGEPTTPPIDANNPTQTAPPTAGGEVAAPQGGGQRPAGGGGGGGRGMRNSMAFLLRNEQIKTELKITEEQVKKIEAAMPEGLRDMEEAERTKAIEKLQADVKAILTADQNKRIRQIQLQMMGTRALTQPDVAKELGLSADQVKKIETALDVPRPEFGSGQPGGTPPSGVEAPVSPEEREKRMEEFRKAREEAETKAMAVLTASQKKKWEAMLGAKFELQRPAGGGAGMSTPR